MILWNNNHILDYTVS